MSDSFSASQISASGLSAERIRMNVIANNLANSNTTRGEDGKPYARKMVIFKEILNDASGEQRSAGVGVDAIVESNAPFKRLFDPSHPDADKEGYVQYPNVNPIEEMVDMITATRAYEANVSAFMASKAMNQKALEMGQ